MTDHIAQGVLALFGLVVAGFVLAQEGCLGFVVLFGGTALVTWALLRVVG